MEQEQIHTVAPVTIKGSYTFDIKCWERWSGYQSNMSFYSNKLGVLRLDVTCNWT